MQKIFLIISLLILVSKATYSSSVGSSGDITLQISESSSPYKFLPFSFKKSTSVGEVKEKLSRELGYSFKSIRLVRPGNSSGTLKPLSLNDNDMILEAFDLREGDEINVFGKKGPCNHVRVKVLGTDYPLSVGDSTLIGEIKEAAKKRASLSEEDVLQLIYAGKKLQDDKTVDDYNIVNEAVIWGVVRFKRLPEGSGVAAAVP